MRSAAAIASVIEPVMSAAGQETHLRAATEADTGAIHALIVRHLDEGRLLPRELSAELAPHPVDRLAEHRAVGTGEVDQLEDAAAHRPR